MPSELTGPGAFIEEQPGQVHAIRPTDTATTAFVGLAAQGPVDDPTEITSWAEYASLFGGATGDGGQLSTAVALYFLNGGRRAVVVRTAGAGTTVDDHVPIDPGSGRGLYALDQAEVVNVLCVPDLCAGPFSPQDRRTALEACLAYCARRRAMLIVDPPPEWDSVAAIRSGTPLLTGATENAALYVPRLTVRDPVTGVEVARPPSGAVAGVWARTDALRGVWRAPAGGVSGTLDGVAGLTVELTGTEIAELSSLGVNCLRQLPGAGPLVWGARTLRGDSATSGQWTYLPVRRLALHIEESVSRGTSWAVFEPNAEPLWEQLRRTVGSFLQGLWRVGALLGATPDEAFLVRCGADTTTQHDIDRGVVNIVVGFAPLRPAEFVLLLIQQAASRTPA
ncbi:phage tail sheath family protein [Modestobacter marinus]|uniref:phage tail sheath family protein n=1 Tax=Modestobacter marinus TaxID=477641 RepID=UPI001C969962|nr:phage tail sheath subtilisin-like domain-containing protein [Modestobacter marinus]